MKKKILSIMLSLALVLAMTPMMGSAAYAEGNTDIQNVSLASDGTLTWDAFEGAAQYNFNISNFNKLVEGTSCNLSEILEDHGKTSGNYDIELYAIDDDYLQISTTHYLTYSYTAKNPQLATPANLNGMEQQYPGIQ